jgi:hypothetical protein
MVTVKRVIAFMRTAGITLPWIMTPSRGRHFLFELADGIDYSRIKNHVCHPKENGAVVPWDFKLGQRTMLVAPGTVKIGEGGEVLGRYVAGKWCQPPQLDPRALAPSLDIYKDMTPFVRDTRPQRDRIMGAMSFLKSKAPICRGEGARRTLWEVAVHLVVYYDLDPYFVLYLMTVDKGQHISWNSRCVDGAGKPYPWDKHELLEVLQGVQDDVPPWGVAEYKRQEDCEQVRWCLASFIEALRHLDSDSSDKVITADALFRFFCDHFDVPEYAIVVDHFGAQLHGAIESGQVKSLQPHRTNAWRGYKGANVAALEYALELYRAGFPTLPDSVLLVSGF